MGPVMVAAVVSAVIGAAGTVIGAWIQSRSRRPREDQAPPGSTERQAGSRTGVGLGAGRVASPDDHR
jgi:hypothetical protein